VKPAKRRRLAAVMACWASVLTVPQRAEADATTDAVESHLGVYLIRTDRRDPDERVRRPTDDRAEVWFLRSMPLERRDETLCEALRWLLVGRLESSPGALPLFRAHPELKELALVFFAVDTSVAPNSEGRYTQERMLRTTARITLLRETAAQLDRAGVAAVLTGARCASEGRAFVDEVHVP
jgi:hypothetical protein